jgi:hypothetical protein
MKEKWLTCSIYPGQFSGEFAVCGRLFDDTAFSMFAEEENLRFDKRPGPDERVGGWIRVLPLGKKGDSLLVFLPQPTFENGQTITVKATDVKEC